jgi:hypothetical protein
MMGMPSCREVSRSIASGQAEEPSLRLRLGVRLHLLMCRHCRRYARQIRAIGLAARQVLAGASGERDSLERLQATILARLESPDDD